MNHERHECSRADEEEEGTDQVSRDWNICNNAIGFNSSSMALYNRARASFEGLNQYDLAWAPEPAEPNLTESSRTELN